MNFEDMCKLAVDHGKQPKYPEAHLPYEECSRKEQSRRINNMFSNIAIKNSTRQTLDRVAKNPLYYRNGG